MLILDKVGIIQKLLTGFVLIVLGLIERTATPVLLNVLSSTRYYVGSYVRDARLRPSKAVQYILTMTATSAGRKRRPWSTTIIGPHVS